MVCKDLRRESLSKALGVNMLLRRPVVAGKFYPADKQRLQREVQGALNQAALRQWERPPHGKMWGVMLPHAGYVYCGNIIADALAGASLPPRLVVLGPNHTGQGRPLGLWPDGAWLTPLGEVSVDAELGAQLAATGIIEPDIYSHLGEHSIEVLLPFLQEALGAVSIAPIAVGTRNPAALRAAGLALAEVLKRHEDVGVVVSSDMNHYEDHETTLAKDELALAKACVVDADGLLDVTARENISMCGAPALAIALYAAKELGRNGVTVTSHATSGDVSADYDHTVGYAGLQLWDAPTS